MSQTTGTPTDDDLIAASDPVANEGVFFTVAQLRAAMSPVGYMTPADQINAAAAAAAQATANAAIPSSTLGQPLGPVQSDATNKVPLANLPSAVLGSSHYLGTWNASTNTPVIVSRTAPAVSSPVGGYYIVSVSGTQSIDGNSTWHAGDWIIWNGTVWSDISGQVNPVSSVAGLQGAVSTAQLATALAGTVGLTAASGLLNVEFGTTAATAAAGNDSRIVGAAQSANVATLLANVAAIIGYTGNSPALRTAGYYTAGDGGGAYYTQSNTGAPAIVDGAARNWYLQDVDSGPVNILQFGAKPDGSTDIQPAWAAADAFAAANNKAVFIPSQGSGSWVLKTPMLATAIETRGEAVNIGSGHGTVIRWIPPVVTELATALTNNPGSGAFLVANLSIQGHDVLPTVANIVSSGWLPAIATATCTFSGSVMTASGTTGTWAVGQNVCGPGMTSFCTITSLGSGTGGDGTYNLSAPQSLSGSITVTATGYPNLSAFKAGTACFRAANSGSYRNCFSSGSKYGVVFDTPFGHVFSYNCSWEGFFGVYCRQNGYDFFFDSCGFAGTWSNFLAGTGAVAGVNAGITFRAMRCHFGFSPIGIDILNDGGSYSLTGRWEFYGCSFESLGEAMFRTLPSSASLEILLDMYPVGTFNDQYSLPTSIIGLPQQYFFNLRGQLDSISGLEDNSYVDGVFYSGYPGGSKNVAYIGSILGSYLSDLDLDIFSGQVDFGTRPYTIDVRNPDYSRDYLKRRDQIIRSGVLEKGNLLLNPEIATNWTVVSGGTTISVVPLSTLTATALAGITVPARVYRENDNPNVIVITNSSTAPDATLGMSAAAWNVNRSICLHGWIYSTGSGTASNVNLQLVTNNSGYYGVGQESRGGTIFQEVFLQGEHLTDFGATSVSVCSVGGAATGQVIYLIGLMVSYDRPSAPNQLPGPYAPGGLFIGNENAGLTAAQAFSVIPFAGTPSGAAPNGSLGIDVNATGSGSLYQYLNHAWVQIH